MDTPNVASAAPTIAPTARLGDEIITTASRSVGNAEIKAFVEATGDDNSIHLYDHAAQAHGFPSRVVHGKLVQCVAIDLIRRKEEQCGFAPILLEDTWRSLKSLYPNESIFVRYTRKVAHGIAFMQAEVITVRKVAAIVISAGTIKARVNANEH